MKHTFKELYRTTKGLSMVNTDNTKSSVIYKTCDYKKNDGSFTYINLNGRKCTGWQFGERTWFDTREERNAYKTQSNKEYEEKVVKNKVLKEINAKLNEKNIEELLDILSRM